MNNYYNIFGANSTISFYVKLISTCTFLFLIEKHHNSSICEQRFPFCFTLSDLFVKSVPEYYAAKNCLFHDWMDIKGIPMTYKANIATGYYCITFPFSLNCFCLETITNVNYT